MASKSQGTKKAKASLRFHPNAYFKLRALCLSRDTEVAGYGVCLDEGDPLLVHEFHLLPQEASSASFEFDDEGFAAWDEEMSQRGLEPLQYSRVWIHTHPGNSPSPSGTDESEFNRFFSGVDFAVMAIMARDGSTYARLRLSLPDRGIHNAETVIPFEVLWNWDREENPPPIDYKALMEEAAEKVKKKTYQVHQGKSTLRQALDADYGDLLTHHSYDSRWLTEPKEIFDVFTRSGWTISEVDFYRVCGGAYRLSLGLYNPDQRKEYRFCFGLVYWLPPNSKESVLAWYPVRLLNYPRSDTAKDINTQDVTQVLSENKSYGSFESQIRNLRHLLGGPSFLEDLGLETTSIFLFPLGGQHCIPIRIAVPDNSPVLLYPTVETDYLPQPSDLKALGAAIGSFFYTNYQSQPADDHTRFLITKYTPEDIAAEDLRPPDAIHDVLTLSKFTGPKQKAKPKAKSKGTNAKGKSEGESPTTTSLLLGCD